MLLRECSMEEIVKARRGGEVQAIISEFMNMDADCVEVTNHPYKSVGAGALALRKAVARSHYGITVSQAGDKLYLIKKSAEK